MKQTIISKCFGKMKRVALTLFAALCVGSVWAEEGDTTTPEVTPETEPTPSTPALNIDESYGYVRTGLGELGDQAIVVFTNSAEGVTCTWTPPKGLKNIEFLAVGGGGGGGGHFFRTDSGTNKKYNQGGAGGGGGAVVVGFIKDLAATDIVSVTVGAGGKGGSATSYSVTNDAGAGHADPGSNSVIRVNGTTYITAYGGAGDGGKDSAGVANGGSNSGVRKAQSAIALKSVTVIGAGVEGLVSDVVAYANKGGPGKATDSGYAAAGGGGAHPTEGEGHQSSGSSYGGHGGYGYESYITDSLVYYGAGGGGGTGKSSGTGTVDWGERVAARVHGAGRSPANANGTSGLPNQGGGGGGGSYKRDGGAGGSGVVILRFGYSETDIPVDATVDILPKISDKVYTGEVLSSGLVETFAYKVEELKECVNVGVKVVRATLNEGYAWADGSTERYKDFEWNILKQENNVWVTTPFINVDSWGQTYTSSVIFHQAEPLLGNLIATIATNGGEPQPFNGSLPDKPGTYKIVYRVENTSNYSDLYWEKTFKIYPSELIEGGYKVTGLGEKGDEIAVVFTENANWTVPVNIKNARFLVVGAGGGGGADVDNIEERMAGAGGGGGGVVTGYINLPKNQVVSITVGTGGTGGIRGDDGLLAKWGAAQSAATDSLFSLDDSHYVKAYAGGADMGSTDVSSSKGGQQGGAGGSSAGSRPTNTNVGGSANKGDVASGTVISSTKYGNKGGKGASQYQAGGGGGATAVGGNGVAESGGVGGEGLASDITGALLVYGSGGGGGGITADAANGGTGAGNGGRYNNATSGMPNQGGGGGGAGRVGNGGNGGSGIVVFRYKVYAAEVNSTPYDTLGAALEAATAGATIKVLNDVATDAAFVITKKVTIDLNGKTIATTQADAEGNGVFWVKTGGELTIIDSVGTGVINGVGGNNYNMAIWADGGKVVINGGTFTNEGATSDINNDPHFDLIYVKNGGEVVINGGTFKCQTPKWTLNIKNGEGQGTITVNAGTFYGFDPANCETDDLNSYCAEGLCGYVVETVDGVDVYGVATAIAMVGDEMYPSFDAALEAAASGDTVKLLADVVVEKVVVVPTGATLDLNGKSIQSLAVVGKLDMNGGALKTYDTNTQTYFFMAAPAQTAGALYWTSDAVMTIGDDYALSLDGGSVTLPNSWRSLLKQSLTIKSGATFVIPQGVELNLRGNAVVESGATLTCEGTIALGNTYDAIDTSATLTSAQLAEGMVTSAVEGYKAIYENGAYKLVEATVTVAPGGVAAVVDTEADADAVEIAVEVPAGVNISLDAYKAYFTKSVTQNSEGKYEVTAVLDDTKVKPVIAETTADDTTKKAFVIDADGNVTLNINNKKPGLYYGVQVLAELGADPVVTVSETADGLVVPAEKIPEGNAAFFRVVVDFEPIGDAE